MDRRTVLRGALFGAGALSAPGLLVACGGGPGGGDTVSFGSNYSDAVPKKALAKVVNGFEKSEKKTVKVNTVDHNTFQENINRYLKGSPDDAFTWFAGFRMQFFAKQGLATDISDVWGDIGGDYAGALKQASTGEDDKQYFVPFYYYPWAVFYRKSLWQERGYEPAKNLDEFVALCKQMRSDGLTPIAFADKDGWPAMGTFDYLNMRINGFDFHMSLMRGEENWQSAAVKEVFTTWRELLPYHQKGANGRTWQEAAQSLDQKKTGMYLLGMFVGQSLPEASGAEDIDFFPFPEINPEHGQDSVEAPIDGFMISAKAKNVDGAKDLLKYLGSAKAQETYLASDPNNVATNKSADTSGYNALQQKAVQLVTGADHISQFLDRDTRPDFASTVMIPALQEFINKPDEVDGLLKSIETQKKNIFTT
ncbi:MAG: extracellular solute-binding protein [Micromonosporaceae bacterium]|nr:extracellular solute-binding protein [Micromonosporaceae bacterium]